MIDIKFLRENPAPCVRGFSLCRKNILYLVCYLKLLEITRKRKNKGHLRPGFLSGVNSL